MHQLDLLQTLTGCLTAALALGYVTQRAGLPPLLGYLLAGVVVGPNTPGFVADQPLANELAEIGVILLMFGVGLHSDVNELLAVRRVVVPGAILQGALSTAMGAGVAAAFGWKLGPAVAFGLCLSVSSTVVLTRVLVDRNELHTALGRLAVGWLVVQDLLAVVVLVVMPALLGPAGGAGSLSRVVVCASLKIAALIAAVLVIGGRVIPWLLRRVAATYCRELFILTILVVATGIAVTSARLFDVSMAMGAFLAGLVVARSDFGARAATEALPMRDAFAVLFFVAVGMLFDPRFLVTSSGLVMATLAVVLVGTPLAAFSIACVARVPVRVGVGLSLALGQIGEFSFILATVGAKAGLLAPAATQALVAAAIVSISVNPVLCRLAGPLSALLSHPHAGPQTGKTPAEAPSGRERSPAARAIIVGYGPTGRTLVRLLRENQIEPLVVEMNPETVGQLRRDGIPAIYGDVTQPATLVAAGVGEASSLILSAFTIGENRDAIRQARRLNPAIRILVRTDFLKGRRELLEAGADAVFSGEEEIALAMTAAILTDLGATPEQVDRERARVRAELA